MASRGPHKMKEYPTFAAFQADQPAGQRAILRKLRALVKREAPGLEESVKWGNGCWVGPEGPIAFAHAEPDHIQFGFFEGAMLSDPGGLLEGRSKFVRHVKLPSASSVDEAALAPLLREAVERGRKATSKKGAARTGARAR